MSIGKKHSINYRDILDTIPDGFIFIDKSRTVNELNQSAEQILNLSRKKTIGRSIEELFPAEICDLVNKVERDERTISDDEIKIRVFLNQPLSLQVTVTPHLDQDAGITGFILQLRDIEGTKFLSDQSEMQHFNKNFENMILGLTHELKNPLSGIKGAAQLLGSNLSKEDMQKCSEIVINEVDRLSELIDRIKRLDDFDTLNFTEVDINELLLDIIFLQSNLNKDRIQFIKDLDISIPPVSGDANSLKQVFINLIRNAVQSIKDKGRIYVKTKLINDYKFKSSYPILISVRDTGEGIPQEKTDKIFTPFFTTKEEGSGVGLFVSYQIIVKHGGTIMVESEVGAGSEFRIYLPVHS